MKLAELILTMPPISDILNEYIIKTKEKLNTSNVKTYCKCCVDILGEKEGKNFFFKEKRRVHSYITRTIFFFYNERFDFYIFTTGKSETIYWQNHSRFANQTNPYPKFQHSQRFHFHLGCNSTNSFPFPYYEPELLTVLG